VGLALLSKEEDSRSGLAGASISSFQQVRSLCFDLHDDHFEREGTPLVLKSDNGSAFIAAELRELCAKWGVELLWSPPRTPRYNGSVETGMRWLKECTEQVALRAGRHSQWKAG
jgi:transposase InsO family protein